jgi:hypothetical protein
MLKSSGSSYLISGAKKVIYILTTSSHINVTAAESIYLMREYLSHLYIFMCLGTLKQVC